MVIASYRSAFVHLQMLLAMRVHITFGAKDMRRDPKYASALRYMGIEAVPLKDLEYHRSSHPTPAGCRYDLIVVARREVRVLPISIMTILLPLASLF
jgi:hypothetical protein